MPDLTTDPEMMRAQQDKDTRQHIGSDQASGAPEVSDADPASGKAREAARNGDVDVRQNRLDAVFQDNDPDKSPRAGSRQSDRHLAENTTASEKGQTGLAQPGRSRLGN